jgi:UDP-N-acetylmuramoyl-tripeptide--D-alanyl-D-alanine ligase
MTERQLHKYLKGSDIREPGEHNTGVGSYKMIKIDFKDLADVAGAKDIFPGTSQAIKGVSIDSRAIRPGELFIAVKGENFDGHDFIAEAARKGASAIMAENFPESFQPGGRAGLIRVPDTVKAMGKLAAYVKKRSGLAVLCVTGTNGKTTVKDMAAGVLSRKYSVLKSRRSYNNMIGLSLTLFDVDPSNEVAVLEVGTNNPGEIAELGAIAVPSAVIITNVSDGHLQAFGDREGVFREKVSILDEMAPAGTAFLNGDDELLSGVNSHRGRVKFYGTRKKCDYRITDIKSKDGGFVFFLNGAEYFIPIEGVHNVHNAAAAIAAADHLGVDHELIRESIRRVSLPGMRLEKIKAGNVVFLNDSYNSNPGSFESALETIKNTSPRGEKWVVAGDMLELGEGSDELHRSIGRSLAAKKIDFLIVLGEKAESILQGALESGMARERTYVAGSHKDAADIIKNTALPDTVVLIKGSRKTRMEEVLKCFTSSCTR